MSKETKGAHLKMRHVAKAFGRTQVLKDIRLDAEPGEFVAIVGRSGCGKSTLLRLAAGLEGATEGLLVIDGKAIDGIPADTRVLFQDSRLLPWKKVLDNVRIVLPGDDRERAIEALRMVGLEEKAQQWPASLSGGQRQRVALARALAGGPRLLLLDEPLGALDALTRIEMQNLIEMLWRKHGFTVLLVTHDVSEAVALADRVVLIEDGRIELDIRITLDRPRERDSGFAFFEKTILDKLLTKETSSRDGEPKRQLQYSI